MESDHRRDDCRAIEYMSDCEEIISQKQLRSRDRHGKVLNGEERIDRKRQKPNRWSSDSISEDYHTASFWESLSKIWLTKSALNELQRRICLETTLRSLPLQRSKSRRPITRSYRKDTRKNESKSFQSSTEFLRHCKP